MKRKKLTIVVSHPIQYHAPLYTKIAEAKVFDLHVLFHNDRGVRPYFERFSNTLVSYDNNLLDGYSYEFLTQGEARNIGEKFRHHHLQNLDERIAASNPDAVYFHGYSNLAHIRAFPSLKKKGIKLFFRGENEDVIQRPHWRNMVRETFLRYFLKECDALLYIGKKNREFYKRRGVPDHKLFFVPYSADNQYFGLGLPQPERMAIRKKICAEFQLNENSVIFINTCKHRSEKRPLDLLNAYLQATTELGGNGDSTLLLVGDGPLNGEMRRKVADFGAKTVCFAGFVAQSKMRDLLLASDYCINPAEEPWGCVFNEALPAGLGLISSDRVLGWPDMVRIGENGFIYRCGCRDSLAAILAQCARHLEWREVHRQASWEIAKIYSYETCVKGLSEALGA